MASPDLLNFLGYTFRPRSSKNGAGKFFVRFAPAVSEQAANAMRQRMRCGRLHHRHDLGLDDLARWARPMVMGWVRDDGRFHASALRRALRTLDDFLVRWAQRKYKRLRAHKGGEPGNGCGGGMPDSLSCLRIWRWGQRLDDRSRMNREVHVRFWEGLTVRFRWAAQLFLKLNFVEVRWELYFKCC